jgi:hypothetical protein
MQFHELLLAYGSSPLRSLIAQFDGCSGGKAGEIVSVAKLDRATFESVNRHQAKALLEIARATARKVSAERLGCVGRDAFPGHKYAIEYGYAFLGSESPNAEIPFVVEAWAEKTGEKGNIEFSMSVNRTPVTGEIGAYRNADKHVVLRGCGLAHFFEGAQQGQVQYSRKYPDLLLPDNVRRQGAEFGTLHRRDWRSSRGGDQEGATRRADGKASVAEGCCARKPRSGDCGCRRRR